jgi:hypothetical protein
LETSDEQQQWDNLFVQDARMLAKIAVAAAAAAAAATVPSCQEMMNVRLASVLGAFTSF